MDAQQFGKHLNARGSMTTVLDNLAIERCLLYDKKLNNDGSLRLIVLAKMSGCWYVMDPSRSNPYPAIKSMAKDRSLRKILKRWDSMKAITINLDEVPASQLEAKIEQYRKKMTGEKLGPGKEA